MKEKLKKILDAAKESSRNMAVLDIGIRNRAISRMADAVIKNKAEILKANKIDVDAALKKKYSRDLVDRLELNDKRIKGMSDSLIDIARLDDPVGRVIESIIRPNGLKVEKVSVPIGVILIIYESRPNVTSDCVGLCVKSANSVLLRGGSEAINSNIAIYNVLKKAARESGLPQGGFTLIKDTDRKMVRELLARDDYIDLVIPRGGESLIKEVARLSRMPVIRHYKGVCHVYVDKEADLEMAEKISFNAKVQRPGVCNAMETLLVHEGVAGKFLPDMIKKFKDAGVEIRGCPKTMRLVKGIKKASEEDWYTEYLALILSVKVVANLDEAIAHIQKYGSQHSDSIITKSKTNAQRFLMEVDSACVYVNASTRFTDGGEFGKGAEIGISTSKLHARGPMGASELCTYKYMIFGNGQVRRA